MEDKIFRVSVYFVVASFVLGLIKVPFVHLLAFFGAPICFLIQLILIVRSFKKGEENAKFKLLVFIFLLILAFCKVWFPHYGTHAHILFHEPHFH